MYNFSYMNNFDWRFTAWLIARKLSYYFLVVAGFVWLMVFSMSLLTAASTLSFVLGGLLMTVDLGIGMALFIRECMYYLNKID